MGKSPKRSPRRKACTVPSFVPTTRNQSESSLSLTRALSGEEGCSKLLCTRVSQASRGRPWCSATLWKASLARSVSRTRARTSRMLKRRRSRGVVEFTARMATPPRPPPFSASRRAAASAEGTKKTAISPELSHSASNCQMGQRNALRTCTLEFGGGGSVESSLVVFVSTTRMAMSSETNTTESTAGSTVGVVAFREMGEA
mmetsp:Transcript_93091/g.199657  ORF Transcript_93091/g.199657 Transcript_93091/m.199657 type:complete len:201 (+) Transcript_93091:2904-3506(+)